MTITDDNGCAWVNSANPVELSCSGCTGPNILYTLIEEANCGKSDGSALVKIQEDASAYAYIWTPDLGEANDIGNERAKLPAGGYVVEIRDTSSRSECSETVHILVTNKNGPYATVDSQEAAHCGQSDGIVVLSPDSLRYVWSDGFEGHNRTDLSNGIYFVTFSEENDSVCYNVLRFEIDELADFEVSINTIQKPNCGESNGAASASVVGGSGNFTYQWSDGQMGQERTNLSAGVYGLTVTDLATDCKAYQTFALPDNLAAGASITIGDTIDVHCYDGNDGGIVYSVAYAGDFAAPADTLIINSQNTIFKNNNLPSGDYCIVIKDANGCVAATNCFAIEAPDLLGLEIVLSKGVCDSDKKSNLDLSTSGGTTPYQFDWADLDGTDNGEDRNGLEVGTYSLTITDAHSCTLVIPDIEVGCNTGCQYFNERDTAFVTGVDCDKIEYCVKIPYNELGQYEIYVDGAPYTKGHSGCDFDSLVTYTYTTLFGQGNNGPYMLNSWKVGNIIHSGVFANIPDLVDSMRVWEPAAEWQHLPQFKLIRGKKNSGKAYSVMNCSQVNNPELRSIIGLNQEFFANGFLMSLGSGNHELIIVNKASQCADSLWVIANCLVEPDLAVADTIILYADTVTYCLTPSLLGLPAAIVSTENVCPGRSGEHVQFGLNDSTYCVTYTGIDIGTDTACVIVTDAAGNTALAEFYVTVISPKTEVVVDTIFVNQTATFCLDTSQLSAQIVSIENICASQSNDYALFTLDTLNGQYCVIYEGIELGTDTACYVVCDARGVCDTTQFYITVEEYLQLPIAVDDYDTTVVTTPLVIDVIKNDTIYGGLADYGIVTPPRDGQAAFNLDGTITYMQDDRNKCAREDKFTYFVCNPNGCDTATVYIWLECADPIVIFNALSANGDGVNDVFFIAGIEDFPHNTLKIYNRWGTLVFNAKGYRNEWRGTWNDGQDLPDGTYFYVLKLNDPNQAKESYEGYLEIYR